jgi:hypothetical protein
MVMNLATAASIWARFVAALASEAQGFVREAQETASAESVAQTTAAKIGDRPTRRALERVRMSCDFLTARCRFKDAFAVKAVKRVLSSNDHVEKERWR